MNDGFIYLIPTKKGTNKKELEKLATDNMYLRDTCRNLADRMDDLLDIIDDQRDEIRDLKNLLYSSYKPSKKAEKRGTFQGEISVEVSPIKGFSLGARFNRNYT